MYEQGAGRIDLAKAYTQRVFATTGGVDFGSVTEEGEPLRRELSYSNLTDQPVTLTLTPALRTVRGDEVAGKLTTDPTLTVPAGGTATTTVTLETAGPALGNHTGAVTAEAGDIRLTTPVGLVREAPTVQLTVHVIGWDGKPLPPWYQQTLDIDGEKGYIDGSVLSTEGTTVTRVPVGTSPCDAHGERGGLRRPLQHGVTDRPGGHRHRGHRDHARRPAGLRGALHHPEARRAAEHLPWVAATQRTVADGTPNSGVQLAQERMGPAVGAAHRARSPRAPSASTPASLSARPRSP